jgi:hypothetical protein
MTGTDKKLRELAALNGWTVDVDPLGGLHGRYGDRVLYVEFGQTGHVGYAYTRIQPEHSHEIPTNVEAVRPADSGRAGVVFDWITKYGKYGQPGGNQYTVTYELNDVEYDGVIRQWETAVLTLPEKSRTAARASLLAHDVSVRQVHDVRPFDAEDEREEREEREETVRHIVGEPATEYAVIYTTRDGRQHVHTWSDEIEAREYANEVNRIDADRTHKRNARVFTRTVPAWTPAD